MMGKLITIAMANREYDSQRSMPFICLAESLQEIEDRLNSIDSPCYTQDEVIARLRGLAIPAHAVEINIAVDLDFNGTTTHRVF